MDYLIDIQDAEANLAKLVDRATSGEDIVIERDGKPAVRLVPVTVRAPRVFGLFKHLIGPEPPGAFDPLTDEELADWE